MNRRVFFERVFSGQKPEALEITAGLEAYKPNENLSEADALHLLMRSTLAATRADVTRAMTMKPGDAVEALFSGNQSPTPPTWAALDPNKENFTDPNARQAEYYRRYYQLQQWWFDLMRTSSFSILEKLTLFWHNLYCSDYLKVYYPQYLYIQNDTFRKMAWGNVKQLSRKMVEDPAMLIYLDNVYSIKGNPNENFARELLELFTLGVNNYTEHDIVEAARALTGWRIADMKGVFNPQLWDPGTKEFMGQSGTMNADDIINTIFSKDAAALYIARRIYKNFVYDIPDEKIVGELATILKQNNFELKPMLKTLLSSAHFFDAQVRGAMIKSPIEFMAGVVRHFNYTALPSDYAVDRARVFTQELLNPPSVEGWKGYHLWINTNTYPLRQRTAEGAIDGRRIDSNQNMPGKIDVVAFAKQFPDVNDPRKFIAQASRHLLAIEPGTKAQAALLEALLLNAQDYEWKIDMPNVELRLRSFLQAVVTLPEYQLI